MQFIRAAAGDLARHSSPIRLPCGSNHSILCGLVFGSFKAISSVCDAVQVKLMDAQMGRLLDGGVEEIVIRGSPNQEKVIHKKKNHFY